MAVTIGELTDVPDPGSPIGSAWAQEVSKRVVQRFPTISALVAAWPAATAGVGALAVVTNVNHPVLYVSNGVNNWKLVVDFSPLPFGAITLDATHNVPFNPGATTAIMRTLAVPAGLDSSRRYRVIGRLPQINSTVTTAVCSLAPQIPTSVNLTIGYTLSGLSLIVYTDVPGDVIDGKTISWRVSAASGNVSVATSSTQPAHFSVEDIGMMYP